MADNRVEGRRPNGTATGPDSSFRAPSWPAPCS